MSNRYMDLDFARQRPREDDIALCPAEVLYGDRAANTRWETTQEIPRMDVVTAVQITSRPAQAYVLELLATTDCAMPAPGGKDHFGGYNPYDTARVARWDKYNSKQRALTQKMTAQARKMFATRERRVGNLRMARAERAAMFVLDVTIIALGAGTVVLALMTLASIRAWP